MPVGADSYGQTLVRVTRRVDGEDQQDELSPVAFVPLIGAEGFEDATRRRFHAPGVKAT